MSEIVPYFYVECRHSLLYGRSLDMFYLTNPKRENRKSSGAFEMCRSYSSNLFTLRATLIKNWHDFFNTYFLLYKRIQWLKKITIIVVMIKKMFRWWLHLAGQYFGNDLKVPGNYDKTLRIWRINSVDEDGMFRQWRNILVNTPISGIWFSKPP